MVNHFVSGHQFHIEKAGVIADIFDIAPLGEHRRIDPFNKFGHNAAVGTAEVDVNSFGNLLEANIHDAGEAVAFELVSDNPLDDKLADNAGAWTVRCTMVTDAGLEVDVDVDTDGTTVVPIIDTDNTIWLHCNRAEVIAWKSGTVSNIGNISIQEVTGDYVHAEVEALENQTLQTLYYVPTNYSHLLIKSVFYSTAKNEDVLVRYKKRSVGLNFITKDLYHVTGDGKLRKYCPPLVALPGEYIKLTADATSATTPITGNFDGILIKN